MVETVSGFGRPRVCWRSTGDVLECVGTVQSPLSEWKRRVDTLSRRKRKSRPVVGGVGESLGCGLANLVETCRWCLRVGETGVWALDTLESVLEKPHVLESVSSLVQSWNSQKLETSRTSRERKAHTCKLGAGSGSETHSPVRPFFFFKKGTHCETLESAGDRFGLRAAARALLRLRD